MKDEDSTTKTQRKLRVVLIVLIPIALGIGVFAGYSYGENEGKSSFTKEIAKTTIKFVNDTLSTKATRVITKPEARIFTNDFFSELGRNVIDGKHYVEWGMDFKGWSIKTDILRDIILNQKDINGNVICTDLVFHIALRDGKPTLVMTGAIPETNPKPGKDNTLKMVFLETDNVWGMQTSGVKDGILEWVDPCPKACPDTFD